MSDAHCDGLVVDEVRTFREIVRIQQIEIDELRIELQLLRDGPPPWTPHACTNCGGLCGGPGLLPRRLRE